MRSRRDVVIVPRRSQPSVRRRQSSTALAMVSGSSAWTKWMPLPAGTTSRAAMLSRHQRTTGAHDGAGLEGQQQLGHTCARREPLIVGFHCLHHVGGLTVDGDLPRPDQRGSAVLTVPERLSIPSISSALSWWNIEAGRTASTNRFWSRISCSPVAGVRKAAKISRPASGNSSQPMGLTIVSMTAMARTRSGWRLAQWKPKAPPKSWPTSVTRSSPRASNQASS
jgi:hypothetical protein